ncbi:hypothetical protein [Burkholderia sp. BCC0397]|uniref:hypothetical protein n=1 Tax=Burkholderia sp. BCC0397 TaxID=486876 RepID=UPI00158EF95D|nr:hypothetical protein [Burkholderia sp. BCC0397]
MQIKIDGLDKLKRQLEEAGRAFKSLDGDIAKVNIVPGDPASVQAAIRQMEAAIDRKASGYRGNPLVESVVKQIKERYRADIVRRGRG